MNLNYAYATFWVSLTLVAPNRTSYTSTVTFLVYQQALVNCFSIADRYSFIVLTDPASLVYPIILHPQISYFCNENILFDTGLTWISNQASI